MNRAFPDYRYDETQDVYYYRIGGKIISVSYFVTDSGEQIVSISIQEEGSSGP